MAESHGVLERRLKMQAVGDQALRALINVQLADAHFQEDFEQATGHEGLSVSAYNVLRILRGEPEGHPRREIAERMIYRKTDLTRIIDGLVRRGFAERMHSRQDRRLSVTKITAKGLKVMARLDPAVQALVERYREKLSERDYRELNRLLETLYAHHVD